MPSTRWRYHQLEAFKLLILVYALSIVGFFYIHGSTHRESNSIIYQQDVTYSVYYISVGTLHVLGVYA